MLFQLIALEFAAKQSASLPEFENDSGSIGRPLASKNAQFYQHRYDSGIVRGKQCEFGMAFPRDVCEHTLRYLREEGVSGEGGCCGKPSGYHPIHGLQDFQFDNMVDTFCRATGRRVMMTIVGGYRIKNSMKSKWEKTF